MNYENAKKIIYKEGQIENVETLLKNKTLQIGLQEKELCTMKGKASFILDFGKELSGGARILTHGVGGCKTVRLRFGESVGETCSELKNGEDSLYMVENIGNPMDELMHGKRAGITEIDLSNLKGELNFYVKGKKVEKTIDGGKLKEKLRAGDALFIEIKR